MLNYVGYYFQSLKGKKYFILSLKCYECLQKQRDDIKSNCCPVWSLMFRFFSSIKWIFFYNFCRTFGPALQHFLSDIHKKCPIVRQVRRISTPLLELCINSKITLLFPPYVSAHGLHQWKWYMYWRYNKQWCCDVITAPKWRNSHGVVGMSCNAQNI